MVTAVIDTMLAHLKQFELKKKPQKTESVALLGMFRRTETSADYDSPSVRVPFVGDNKLLQ